MIYTVTLNPAVDKTLVIRDFSLGAVNRILSQRIDPGGKGINVSRVIHALGGESIAAGLLAGESGAFIQHSLHETGISCHFLQVPGQTRTNFKITDPVSGICTDINEAGDPVSPEALDGLLSSLCRMVQPEDIVVLSGSLPKGAPEALYADWISALCRQRVRVLLDADGAPLRYGLSEAPHGVKPNRQELERLMGHPLETREALADAGQQLLSAGVRLVCISLGADGALLVTSDGTWYAPGIKVPVRGTVGAGDSMVAALALGLQQGHSPEQNFRMAMAASAASVSMPGTQPPSRELVRSLMDRVSLVSLP